MDPSRSNNSLEVEAFEPDVFVHDDRDSSNTVLGRFLSSDGASAREIAKSLGGTALIFLKNNTTLILKSPPAGLYKIVWPFGNFLLFFFIHIIIIIIIVVSDFVCSLLLYF